MSYDNYFLFLKKYVKMIKGDIVKAVKDFYNHIKDINYGWHDKEGKIHERLTGFHENFILQDADTIVKDNYAVCWEMCELERDFLNINNIENKTIFVILKNTHICHTFIVYKENDKYYWLEASWANKKGIHKFNSLEEILDYYRDNFQDFAKREYDRNDLEFYEYKNIYPGMNCESFYETCFKGTKL